MKRWHDEEGKLISCYEKLKVMQQNIDELRQVAIEAFEDGVLMGVDPKQIRECFVEIMLQLK